MKQIVHLVTYLLDTKLVVLLAYKVLLSEQQIRKVTEKKSILLDQKSIWTTTPNCFEVHSNAC